MGHSHFTLICYIRLGTNGPHVPTRNWFSRWRSGALRAQSYYYYTQHHQSYYWLFSWASPCLPAFLCMCVGQMKGSQVAKWCWTIVSYSITPTKGVVLLVGIKLGFLASLFQSFPHVGSVFGHLWQGCCWKGFFCHLLGKERTNKHQRSAC